MDQMKETCIKSGDNTDDGDDNVSLVLRPNPVERGVDMFICDGDGLEYHQGPRTMTVVESIKMIVMIPNKNMCSRQWNTDPLELQERAKKERLSVRAGNGSIGNEKHIRTEVP